MIDPRSTTASRLQTAFSALAAFVAMPWAAFVAVFLYTVLLTLLVLGGGQLSNGFMAVAYGAPVAAYAMMLLARAVRAIAALPVHFAPMKPHHALPQ